MLENSVHHTRWFVARFYIVNLKPYSFGIEEGIAWSAFLVERVDANALGMTNHNGPCLLPVRVRRVPLRNLSNA